MVASTLTAEALAIMAKTSAETAIELRAKLEFYLLALTFSILGLSIQTAEFGNHLGADSFELAGWLALFVAGVVGIMRAEWVPVAYEIDSKITSIRRRYSEVEEGLRRGVQVPFPFVDEGKDCVLYGEQAATKLDKLVATLEQKFREAEKKIIGRYNMMRLSFMVGIGCLLIARGLPPTVLLVKRVATWWASLPSS